MLVTSKKIISIAAIILHWIYIYIYVIYYIKFLSKTRAGRNVYSGLKLSISFKPNNKCRNGNCRNTIHNYYYLENNL